MKTITVLIAMIPMLAGQAAVIPAKTSTPDAVYIVTRASSAESKALFSARLVKMSATNLRWYDGAGVVRAEVPKKSLDAVRADRDVVLVLTEQDRSKRVSIFDSTAQESEAAAQKPAGLLLEPAPPLQSLTAAAAPQQSACTAGFATPSMGQFPQIPGPGMGMGSMGGQPGMGMGMGMGMGLMDSLAGGVANHLFNRTPSCKITVSKSSAKFSAAGGDGVIEVNASGSCAWQAQSSVDWIKITSGSGVSGAGVVSYTVTPGNGKAQSGSVWIVAAAGGSPTKGKASVVVTRAK